MLTTYYYIHYYNIHFITSYDSGLPWVVMKPLLPITDPPNLEMYNRPSLYSSVQVRDETTCALDTVT